MWFEIVIFILAAILPWGRKPQGFAQMCGEKEHLAVWAAAPVLFVVLYQRTFMVKQLLVMMLAYVVLGIAGCAGQRAGKIPEMTRLFFYLSQVLKAAVSLLLYQPCVSDSGMSKNTALLFWTGISGCLFFSGRIRTWAEQKGWQIPAAALGAAVPVLGF